MSAQRADSFRRAPVMDDSCRRRDPRDRGNRLRSPRLRSRAGALGHHRCPQNVTSSQATLRGHRQRLGARRQRRLAVRHDDPLRHDLGRRRHRAARHQPDADARRRRPGAGHDLPRARCGDERAEHGLWPRRDLHHRAGDHQRPGRWLRRHGRLGQLRAPGRARLGLGPGSSGSGSSGSGSSGSGSSSPSTSTTTTTTSTIVQVPVDVLLGQDRRRLRRHHAFRRRRRHRRARRRHRHRHPVARQDARRRRRQRHRHRDEPRPARHWTSPRPRSCRPAPSSTRAPGPSSSRPRWTRRRDADNVANSFQHFFLVFKSLIIINEHFTNWIY